MGHSANAKHNTRPRQAGAGRLTCRSTPPAARSAAEGTIVSCSRLLGGRHCASMCASTLANAGAGSVSHTACKPASPEPTPPGRTSVGDGDLVATPAPFLATNLVPLPNPSNARRLAARRDRTSAALTERRPISLKPEPSQHGEAVYVRADVYYKRRNNAARRRRLSGGRVVGSQ